MTKTPEEKIDLIAAQFGLEKTGKLTYSHSSFRGNDFTATIDCNTEIIFLNVLIRFSIQLGEERGEQRIKKGLKNLLEIHD